MASSPVSRPRTAAWLAFALAAATILLNAQALSGEFVSDDLLYVVQNPSVQEPGSLWKEPFPAQLGRQLGLYRPVTVASYALDFAVFGLDPIAFHLTNLLLAGVVAGLVFWVLLLWTAWMPLALALSALWAFHPTHVEPVAWVSGRSELLALLGGLSGFLLFRRARHSRSWVLAFLAALAVCLGTAAKESGLAWVAVIVADEWMFGIHRVTMRIRRLLPMIGLPLGLWLYRGTVLGGLGPEGQQVVFGDVSGWDRWALHARLLLESLSKTFWPTGLSTHHSEAPFREAGLGSILAAAALLIGIGIASARKRSRRVGFGALVFLLTLAPVLHFIPIGEGFADRFLLAPTFGVALALGACVVATSSRRRIAITIALAGLSVAAAVTSYRQVATWQNERALWTQAESVHPGDPEVLFGLAYASLVHEDDSQAARQAIQWLSRIVTNSPDWRPPDVLFNLGYAHERCSEFQLAGNYYRIAATRYEGPAVSWAMERLLNLALSKRLILSAGEASLCVSRLLKAEPDPSRRRELEQRYRALFE